jgi:hypothetical protein
LHGWGLRGAEKYFHCSLYPFSGPLEGRILFKIVLQELHMQWLICTEGEMHTEFWWADRREGDHLEDLVVDGRIKMK